MVGVSSSTGCSTCRKRKVKCDEVRPSCRKCILSGWECPGYPLRLKYQDEGALLKKKYGPRKPYNAPIRHESLAMSSSHTLQTFELRNFPLSSSEKLASCFCQLLDFDLSTSLNLAAFGQFMAEIPRHIGQSKVFDLSVESLYVAHSALFTGNKHLLIHSEELYGQALRCLQQTLTNKKHARASETLCATVLLAIFETISGTDQNATIKHAGGAMSLIVSKGPDDFEDSFARNILNGLRRKAVIGFIMAGKACFFDLPTWKPLFDTSNDNDPHDFEGFFSIISEVPSVLENFKSLQQTLDSPESSKSELRNKTTTLRSHLISWRASPTRTVSLQSHEQQYPDSQFPASLSYDSISAAGLQCMYLAVQILLSCVLSYLSSSSNAFSLKMEITQFSTQVCQSYHYYARFSPVGSSCVKLALQAALVDTGEESKRAWILERLIKMEQTMRLSPTAVFCGVERDPFAYLRA